jgi:hypothetical protein
MRDRRDPPFQGRLRPKAFDRAAGLVRNHIKPTLGPVKLKDLSPGDLRGMYRAKLDSGLSGRTVAYVHVTLYSALGQAVADGLIPPQPGGRHQSAEDGPTRDDPPLPHPATSLDGCRLGLRFTCKREGERRGSIPRPPLEPQSDVVRYSASWCDR